MVSIDLIKISGPIESTIGIYTDQESDRLLALTDRFNIYVYGLKSHILHRRGDHNMAMRLLYTEDILGYLVKKKVAFRTKAKNPASKLFSYENFEKIFLKKKVAMGTGSHQVLDYLSVSMNYPLSYRPRSMFTSKYSLGVHKFLVTDTPIFTDFSRDPDTQK